MPLTPSTSDAGSSQRPSLSYETIHRHAYAPLTSRKSRPFALPSPPVHRSKQLSPLKEYPSTPATPSNDQDVIFDMLQHKSESGGSPRVEDGQGQSITSREESVSLLSKGKEKESSPQVSSPPSTNASTSSIHSAATRRPTSKPNSTRKAPAWSQMKSLHVIHDPDYPDATPSCLA
ncbi:hypothetical protein FRC03_004571 [Tulasnella sp. 419]|nr:hypothetical protein FRC03_004571 [Tulasnella sp. 419]